MSPFLRKLQLSPLRVALFTLSAVASVEACSSDDATPTPVTEDSDGGGGADGAPPGSRDGGAPGDGGSRPTPIPTERTGLFTLGEATAIRAYSVTAEGEDVLVAGADNFDDDAGDRNAVVFRSDLEGKVRWAKRVGGGSNDQLLTHVVVGTKLEGFGISRTVFTGATRNTDVLWASVDVATGNVEALRHFGTTANDDILGAVAVPDGIVLVGVLATGTPTPDAYIAKVANGAIVWARSWATPGADTFRWVGVSGNELVAVGYSSLVPDGKNEPVIAVFDANGNHVRSRRLSGGPGAILTFSARVVGGDVVAVGQAVPGAGASALPFAFRAPIGEGPLVWASTYAVAGATGNGSFRATTLSAPDEPFGLPETLSVAGSAGGRAVLARLSTADGQPLARTALRAPAEAVISLDREVLWERADRGFGVLFQTTPKGSAISGLGLALPNRLLDLSAGCAWLERPALTVAAPPGLATAALSPTVAPVSFVLAATSPALTATDLPLTQAVGCGP